MSDRDQEEQYLREMEQLRADNEDLRVVVAAADAFFLIFEDVSGYDVTPKEGFDAAYAYARARAKVEIGPNKP